MQCRVSYAVACLTLVIGPGATMAAPPAPAGPDAAATCKGFDAVPVSGSDPHVYNSMNVRLRGGVVSVEITSPCVRTVAQLKEKTVELAISLTRYDKHVRSIEVYSSAPGSPNALAMLKTQHVDSFRRGLLRRSELIHKVSLTPLRKGRSSGRWDV